MDQQQCNDSRELFFSEELSNELDEYGFDWKADCIYFPYFLSVKLLKDMSPFYICGGGKNECLKEIELICNAFNIKYKRIQGLVY
jgi:hypothetical protein